MNFKLLTHMIFSLVVFSVFASQEIVYNPQGICTIGKMVFHEDKDYKNLSEQLRFLEGLSRFCEEKGMKKGDVIGQMSKMRACEGGNRNDYSKNSNLEFKHLAFPQNATLRVYLEKSHGIVLNRSMTKSPAMEKFVQEMIEKGKSVNLTNN